ncbi:MAG: hypothetical protein JWO36_947 [Myxococcales bacterium]|nr:hypothetical protein [Myxococcales bacterium]
MSKQDQAETLPWLADDDTEEVTRVLFAIEEDPDLEEETSTYSFDPEATLEIQDDAP